IDWVQISDGGGRVDLWTQAHPGFSFKITANGGTPIPTSDTLNANSPNYMVFYAPQLAGAPYDTQCPQDPIVYDGSKGMGSVSSALYLVLQGTPQSFTVLGSNGKNHTCTPPVFPPEASPLAPEDSSNWQMVEIVQAQPGEGTSSVLDLTNFRTGGNLLLRTPRVGFFTTPAFLAEWNTNNSNQARVTANQTLIVALGHAMSPANATLPPSLAS